MNRKKIKAIYLFQTVLKTGDSYYLAFEIDFWKSMHLVGSEKVTQNNLYFRKCLSAVISNLLKVATLTIVHFSL